MYTLNKLAKHDRIYRIQHTRLPNFSRRNHADHHTAHAQVTKCHRNTEIRRPLLNPLLLII